ncbi:MAG: ATPase involved in replication initiation [Tardiphaga sp.]|nr:ATPase involved in replication initiation [Tardiphaga sp.]
MKASRKPRYSEGVDAHRAKHLSLDTRTILTDDGATAVLVNDSESPLAWLARHKGRDGRSMISPHQFIAGEKLRADFTRGNLAPRMTANWAAPTGGRPRGSGSSPSEMTDAMVTSRQRVGQAMEACGPDFPAS